MRLHRYWFRFGPHGKPLPIGVRAGCGVTARDKDDALSLLRERVFAGEPPPILQEIEDVDVSSLDPLHVIPNMDSVLVRGVWFPKGY